MCGIAGKVNFEKDRVVDYLELKRMTDSINHRGPDDEGHYIDGNVGLGFRRLSIIDLYSGHQPLCEHSLRYWIVFNGEIYNYREQRENLKKKGYIFRTNTDTEVILNLYAEYKENCVKHLRGMFAFVIWDTKEKELFGARDRFGIKPFYYYIDEEKFVWGSEIKAISASANIIKEIDIEALDSYFAYGYIFDELSIFKQIRKLKPAHYFLLKLKGNSRLEMVNYWDINFEPDYSKTEAYWKEVVLETLRESVKMHMMSDVPLGAFLSGGIDSSSVVALMATQSTQPIKTFSIGFKEEKYNELKYARQVAKRYNTDHHEMIIESGSIDLLPKLVQSFDEPFADSSAIPTYHVSKFARELVTVSLSGDGGDELFAGYNSYSKMMALKNNIINTKLNKKLFLNINKLLPDEFFGKGYSYYLSKNTEDIGAYFCLWKDYERKKLYSEEIKQKLGEYNSENIKISILNKIGEDFLSRMQGVDMKTYMVDDILAKVDRSSMMNSLEARVPILDHKLAELSFTIPWQLKINKASKKYILKEAMKDLLPPDIIAHKKQGFTIPLTQWFKEDLKSYAFDSLVNGSHLSDYLNINYIKAGLINHQKGLRDYSSKIWSLLVLNEWLIQQHQ